ncbi:ArsR family transcriptional regulator [Sphaerospermopsis reniformis]|uniref:ArsR family transcriptional regulator n=1 Tax=Sphaerospermopsis reniformis TaxID=531300 RepID=A0A479ZS74_9CYAN|nr:metalloregulator ArsR/SmtB family transcription factor [Sphaerospermopsis reniformis]GCL35022.1 ArsR family transcriptional regulator [Sphaerospermopsis reniformis]
MITPTTTTPSFIIAGFHALSEPIRIKVIELLRQRELCVCDLCDILDISQSKLSFHLKNLKEANLVNARQEGRWIYYSLNLPQFQVLEQYLADIHRNPVLSPRRSCCE